MDAFWSRYGLRRNPFFQEPLGDEAPDAELARFFIGRDRDLSRALTQLTHDQQTRVVIVGEAGVGKTTFLNQLLAQVGSGKISWLVPTLPPIDLPAASTHVDFCLEAMRRVLDCRGRLPNRSRDAKQRLRKVAEKARAALLPGQDLWEVVTRAVHGATTISPQIGGIGLATQFHAPSPSAASWVPLARAALEAIVAEADSDIVIAINNAENLARDSGARAREVLRDVRDIFLVPRVHWLLVGTPDLLDRVIVPERQLAGIMQHPLHLAPLGPTEVAALLRRRYERLRAGGRPFVSPVMPEVAADLSRAFVGDLRELLRSLESAVLDLGPVQSRTQPIPLEDLVGAISRMQRDLLREQLMGAAWRHLVSMVLGESRAAPLIRRFREADAVRRLAPIRQPTVHAHKQRWIRDGLVRVDGRTGASEWLTPTGTALLAMLPEALVQGRSARDLLEGANLEAEAS